MITGAEKFRSKILDEIGMKIVESDYHYQNLMNERGDEYRLYEKKNCYALGIGDYTIGHNFQLSFYNPTRMLRFGIVYMGKTTFKLENQEVSSFSPSSFLVVEDHVRGQQAWKKGQHFHGIEVMIYADYFKKVFYELTGEEFDESYVVTNHTYHYLPIEMMQGLQQMQALSDLKKLNAIYLESKMLELIAILYNEIYQNAGETFINQSEYEEVKVGNRILRLSHSDLSSIEKAHKILTENLISPPTIEALSRMVALNTQKLKAGFSHKYHMTIGDFITSLRMSSAAILLCTTNMHIHDIAYEVGYSHSANFIKMFKQHYKMTPLQYRKEKH